MGRNRSWWNADSTPLKLFYLSRSCLSMVQFRRYPVPERQHVERLGATAVGNGLTPSTLATDEKEKGNCFRSLLVGRWARRWTRC
jgi:hypothetical protein